MTPESQEPMAEEQTETPAQESAEPTEGNESDRPKVCIQPQGDGTISVYVEGMQDTPEPVTAQSEEQALKAVLGMLRELPSGPNEEAGMMEGYGMPPEPQGGANG